MEGRAEFSLFSRAEYSLADAAAKPERHVQLGFDLVAVELGGLLDEEEEQAGQGEFESHSLAA